MTRGSAPVIDDGVSRNLIDPGTEALIVSQPWQAALHAEEHLLDDVVDVDVGTHAARDERSELGVEMQNVPSSPRNPWGVGGRLGATCAKRTSCGPTG
jgi:hypothetical protein